MNRERLEITIDVLRHVKPRKFDMNLWLQGNNDEPCKTAACAFGHAALDPRLQAEGLSLRMYLKFKERIIKTLDQYNDMVQSADAGLSNVYPKYKGYEGFAAAMKFYDIDSDTADFLFEPYSYRGMRGIKQIRPVDVIARIEDIMGEQVLYAQYREDRRLNIEKTDASEGR